MSNALLDSVTEHFAELDDPRRPTSNQRHEFIDILVVALRAVIGGANCWTTVADFGRAKLEGKIVETKTTLDRHWYISDRAWTADFLLSAKREHWQVENGLHRVLDVPFREDECRVRKGDGAENPPVLRRMALDLLKREKTHKGGMEARRCRAGWDERYMETVLFRTARVER